MYTRLPIFIESHRTHKPLVNLNHTQQIGFDSVEISIYNWMESEWEKIHTKNDIRPGNFSLMKCDRCKFTVVHNRE